MQPETLLVGDVGGTHTRLALVAVSGPPPWAISHELDISGDFPDFRTILRAYLERAGLAMTPPAAVIAAAGPVRDGVVKLTNRALQISQSDLLSFGFEKAVVVNDFAALAFATDILAPNELRLIGAPTDGIAGQPISVLGAGTGFGVSCLVRDGSRALALTTEGGHIGFAPSDADQMGILSILQQRLGRVSVERILSGPGLEALHGALQTLAGRAKGTLSAEQISTAALSGDSCCRATLLLFCSIYGAVAGDIALAHGARGGVFIGGGIATKLGRFLDESPFRKSFESKGRLSSYMKTIPTKLILNPDATLLGAARAGLEHWRSAPLVRS